MTIFVHYDYILALLQLYGRRTLSIHPLFYTLVPCTVPMGAGAYSISSGQRARGEVTLTGSPGHGTLFFLYYNVILILFLAWASHSVVFTSHSALCQPLGSETEGRFPSECREASECHRVEPSSAQRNLSMTGVRSWEPNGAYQMPAGSLQQLSRNLWEKRRGGGTLLLFVSASYSFSDDVASAFLLISNLGREAVKVRTQRVESEAGDEVSVP